jgi:hypothetical protein
VAASDELARLRLDEGEAKLKQHFDVERQPLDAETLERFSHFQHWANFYSVRYLPARPFSVAGWVIEQVAQKVPPEQIFAVLEAIDKVHDAHGIGTLSQTAPVVAVVAQLAVDAPRSWNKHDKALFMCLPPEIRAVIAKREQERDAELRRLHSERDRERKKVNDPAVAAEILHTAKFKRGIDNDDSVLQGQN